MHYIQASLHSQTCIFLHGPPHISPVHLSSSAKSSPPTPFATHGHVNPQIPDNEDPGVCLQGYSTQVLLIRIHNGSRTPLFLLMRGFMPWDPAVAPPPFPPCAHSPPRYLPLVSYIPWLPDDKKVRATWNAWVGSCSSLDMNMIMLLFLQNVIVYLL